MTKKVTNSLAVFCAVALMGLSISAFAASSWSAPAMIANGGQAFTTSGPDGTEVVGVSTSTGVMAAIRRPGGAWTFSQPLPTGVLVQGAAVNGNGDVMAVWSDGDSKTNGTTVSAGYLTTGSTTWTLVTVAQTAIKAGATVASDGAQGFAVGYVTLPAGTTDCITTLQGWNAAGATGSAIQLSPAGECGNLPKFRSNSAGQAVAGWAGPWSPGIYKSYLPFIRAAQRASDGSWGASTVLYPSLSFQYYRYGGITVVGITTTGDMTVVWYEGPYAFAATQSAAGTKWVLQTIANYGTAGINGESVFTMDAAGNGIAIFNVVTASGAGSTMSLRSYVRRAGSTFASGGTVASDSCGCAGGLTPVMVVKPNGGSFVIDWVTWNAQKLNYNVKSSSRTMTTAWSVPVIVPSTTGVLGYGLAVGAKEAITTWTDARGRVVASTLALP